MLTITLRTDKPESEIGLYENGTLLAYETWQAHRQLAETIHKKLQELLKLQGRSFEDIEAVAFYKGPGSFTGLRIGASVANALAASYSIKIVGETSDEWLDKAISRLLAGETDKTVVPEYGADVHITAQKK